MTDKTRVRGRLTVVDVELEGFAGDEERLHDLVAQALDERSRAEDARKKAGKTARPKAPDGTPATILHLAFIFALVVVSSASILLLGFKGFDVLLQAAYTGEGSKPVAEALSTYLEALGAFAKVVFGGVILAIAFKAWRFFTRR